MANQRLNIMDVLAFAKAGYKPADVKEIMAMSEASEEAPTPAPEEDVKHEVKKEPDEKPVADDVPDYKAMFEELQKKNDELSNQIKELQQTNIAKDVSGNVTKVSSQEAVNNIFRDIL